MTRKPLTPHRHRQKVIALQCTPKVTGAARRAAIHRAVRETLENPKVARAVACGLRPRALGHVPA